MDYHKTSVSNMLKKRMRGGGGGGSGVGLIEQFAFNFGQTLLLLVLISTNEITLNQTFCNLEPF